MGDKTLAKQWFRRAADKGDATACGFLGFIYYRESPLLAVHWWTCSAELGGENACITLGIGFSKGWYGLPKDPPLAKKWLTRMRGAKIKDSDQTSRVEAAN